MQKLSKENILTALMIRLDQIESKIDKLLNSDFRVVTNVSVVGDVNPDSLIEQIKASLGDSVYNEKPTRWPNESYQEYLERIEEYNTAQSDDEWFGHTYK